MSPEQIDVGWIDPEYVSGHFAHSIAGQIRDMEYFGCAGRIYRHSASQPIVARNNLVREFLQESDSPWLWMVDADMVFDKGHVMKLWEVATEHQVDMVTGLAMIWKANEGMPVPSLFYEQPDGSLRLIPNHIPASGGSPVTACGLATVLIHREVFLALQGTGRHPDYDWFDFYTNEDLGITGDEMTGIDVQFFYRARAMGYSLLVEPEAKTWHLEGHAIGHDEWKRVWQKES